MAEVLVMETGSKKKRRMDMVRWYYRSIFDELDELRKHLDTLFREAGEGSLTPLLPAGSASATKMLPVTLPRPGG